MTGKDALKQKLATWLSLHDDDSDAAPETSVPGLPSLKPEMLLPAAVVAEALEPLPLFRAWKKALPPAASLLTGMDTGAETLFEKLQSVGTPPASETVAAEWFSAVHLLPRNLWSLGMEGFFLLAETLSEAAASRGEYGLPEALAGWFRVLRYCGEGNLGVEAASFCLELAGLRPRHFGYLCDRLVSGGEEVHEALKKAARFGNVSEPNRVVLLDFAADLGWLYSGLEFEPLWQMVARHGKPFYQRIARGIAPIGSMRFYCGAMTALGRKKDIGELLAEGRVHRAMALFQAEDADAMAAVLASSPVACARLDSQMEIDLAAELLSTRPFGTENPFRLGELFIKMVDSAQKGVTYQGLMKFLAGMKGRIEGEAVSFVSGYLSWAGKGCAYTPVDVMRMYGITDAVLSAGRKHDRKSLRTVFRALDGAPTGRQGLEFLEKAVSLQGIHQPHVAAVASLLVRAAPDDDAAVHLQRIPEIAAVFSLLTPVDQGKLSSGLAPAWMEKLLDSEPEAGETVVQFLARIQDPSRRLRFLDMIAAPVMQEVNPSDPLFMDCLGFAVKKYNSAPEQDRLREAESLTLQRVFRAGGRVAALDKLMQDFLALPGLSGQRPKELLSVIREICNRFSRQAVWQEGFDEIFTSFLENGIRRILNGFMEVPDALDVLDSKAIGDLADATLPSGTGGMRLSTGSGRSAMTFFGEVLPESVHFYRSRPEKLAGFLGSAIKLCQKSVGGMPAGEEFLLHLSREIQENRAMEFSSGLEAWLHGIPASTAEVDHLDPEEVFTAWAGIHEAREAPRKRIGGITALLTSSPSRRDDLMNVCSILSAGLAVSGVPGGADLDYRCDRAALIRLKSLLGKGRDIWDFLIAVRRGRLLPGDERAAVELAKAGRRSGGDQVNAWAQKTLPPLLNCALMMQMSEDSDPGRALANAEAIVEVVGFLGAENASELLLMVSNCLSSAVFPGQSPELLERLFFTPLWKTGGLNRIELLLTGRTRKKRLLDVLLDRLALEAGTPERVSFIRRYGPMFVSIWGYILEEPFPNTEESFSKALADSWIFSGAGTDPRYPEALREIYDLVRSEVKRRKHATGVVTMEEAREISADMRRKYRDNVESVAILLRWTVDPSREDLLRLLEEHEKLLQAVSSDQELLHLMDRFGGMRDVIGNVSAAASDPLQLKRILMDLAGRENG